MFSALSIIILNPFVTLASQVEPSQINFVAYLDKSTANTIIVEHRGGEALTHYQIRFTISTYTDPPTVFNETKTENDPGPHTWTIGERWVYTSPVNLTDKKVEVQIVDFTTNSVMLDKEVQDITAFTLPYVQVFDPNLGSNGVTETSALLKMYYNFVQYKYYFTPQPGQVHFVYQEIDAAGNPLTAVQSTSPIVPLPLGGYYTYPLHGLTADHRYRFQAIITWGTSSDSSSFQSFWTYSNARGRWHLDEGLFGGGSIAFDSARPPTNGTVNGASFIADVPNANGYLNFTTENQNVEIANHHKFDLTSSITVREWVNSQPGGTSFYGQLTEVDNRSFTNISGEWLEPKVIHIYNDVFAVVYRTSIAPGSTIMTFRVPSSGVFPEPFEIIDSKTFPVGNYQYYPDIISLGNSLYAVSYGSRYFDINPAGFIMTVSITSDGTIGASMIDSYQTMGFFGEMSRIFLVNGSVYGIAFGGDYSEAYLKETGAIITISIDSSGHFSPVLYTKKFGEKYCSKADVVHVNGSIFAVAYNDDMNSTGIIKTLQIDNNGMVTTLHKTHHPLANYMQPSFIAGERQNLYLVAYGGNSLHPLPGILETITITGNGSLGNFSDSLAFPTNLSVEPVIIPASQNIYIVIYSGGYPGFDCRSFTARVTDHIEFRDDLTFTGDLTVPLQGLTSTLTDVNGNGSRFLLLYGSGNTSAGFMATVDINLASTPQMVIKKGDMFQVEIVDTTVTVTVKTSNGFHSTSGPLLGVRTWNHIVFTYTASTLQLYVNCVPSVPVLCSGTLQVNTDPLIFGDGFIGYLDEVGIYAQAFDSGGVNSDYTATNHFP